MEKKIIRIKSETDKNTKIQYGVFNIEFNKDGIGELEVTSPEQEEKLNETVGMFSGSLKFLSDEENQKMDEEKNKELNLLRDTLKEKTDEFDKLKEDFEKLEKEKENLENEVSKLTEENQALIEEKENLKLDIKILKENKGEESDKTKDSEKEQGTEKENDDIASIDQIKEELHSQTVPQLKEYLEELEKENPDIIKSEEFKKLTKKDDIVSYIIEKLYR